MDNLIVVLALIGMIYLYWSGRKPLERNKSQDLFKYKKIHEDGLIELPNHCFRKVLQVYPIDIGTRSHREQAAIWETYRTMVSSLTLPITYIVQSTHVDVTDYYQMVADSLNEFNNPLIREMGQEYLKHIQDLAENRKVRMRKYYIIVKIDLSKAKEVGGEEESVISSVINSVLRAANKQKKLSDEEAVTLARAELDNIINVIKGYLGQMEIRAKVLNKEDVVNLAYETFNRDLATVVRTKEVNEMGAFSLFTSSATPDMIANI